MPPMENELRQWIQSQLQQCSHIVHSSPIELAPLQGDAGFRQYFRINTQPSLLAVYAPKTKGNSESACYFAKISEVLRDRGVPTPQIIACEENKNFLLIEDFGGQSFLDVLNDDSVDMLYSEALMVLSRLQQIPRSAVNLPDYDSSLLHEEMSFFKDWFVDQLLGYRVTEEDDQLFKETFDFLVAKALEQPQVLVHRDYHSRNLIYREGEAPGVIDFQDAVWGPITYDVVSLLRDCYISWSPEQIKRWLVTYGNLMIELGSMPDSVTESQWQCWFDTMGLQRHIKVLGIFSRLFLRDGKICYLNDLPQVWSYTVSVASQYPETVAFAEWCQQRLLPLIKQQDWYQDLELTAEQKAGACA